MGDAWVKDVYLSTLYPRDLAPYLATHQGDSL